MVDDESQPTQSSSYEIKPLEGYDSAAEQYVRYVMVESREGHHHGDDDELGAEHGGENETARFISEGFCQDLLESDNSMSYERGESAPGYRENMPNNNVEHHKPVVPEVTITHIDHQGKDDEPGTTEEESPDASHKTFRPFTKVSYERLIHAEVQKRFKESKKDNGDEGRLVDGEIVFDEVDDEMTKKCDPKLADSQPLPEKLGRIPKDLEGIALEEIDPNITEKSFVIISKKFKKHHIYRFSASRALFCLSPWNPLRRFCLSVISNQWFDWFILLTITVNCGFMMIQPSNEVCDIYSYANGTTIEASIVTDQQIVNSSLTCFKSHNYIKDVPENIFQSIYTLEMLLRIAARGFILNKFTYLRDGWNWLDFVVVLSAYILIIVEHAMQNSNTVDLTGLRAFRVLRVLKGISVVPGLRTIVNAFIKSMKMLAEVMLLMLFCIAIFALLALQLYMGVLRQKCVLNIPATYNFCNGSHPNNKSGVCFDSAETYRKYWLQDSDNYLIDEEGEYVICHLNEDDSSKQCPDGYFCAKAGDNPNWGYTHFDSFPWAMLNTFQLVSLDFWENTYNMIIIASGPWNILFFLMVVLLGSFYLLNLMLAVVFMAYVQEADVEAKIAKEKEEEERAKAKRKENTALLFDPKKLKAQLMQKQQEEAERRASQAFNLEGSVMSKRNSVSSLSPRQAQVLAQSMQKSSNSLVKQIQTPQPAKSDNNSLPTSPAAKRPTTAKGQFLRTASQDRSANPAIQEEMEVMDIDNFYSQTAVNNTNGPELTAGEQSVPDIPAGNPDSQNDDDVFIDDLPALTDKEKRYLMQKFAVLWLNRIRPAPQVDMSEINSEPGNIQAERNHDEDRLLDRNCLCCAKAGLPIYHNWMKFQNMVYKVASDGLFEIFIFLCIAANTVIMATEYYNVCELCRFCPSDNTTCTLCADTCDITTDYHIDWVDGMPRTHSDVMKYSNIVFTVIFTVEAVIKLIAYSKEYFSVGWNIFDLVIVAFSLPDLVFFVLDVESIPGLAEVARIIKICRLLRIVKLAQTWSTMRTLLSIIFGAFGALMNLVVILVIIMFIFAVLGNQLFGPFYERYQDLHNYPELADYGGQLPRWHFNTFFHSLLMVFRILCGEWIEPLWDCMRVAGAGCAALFLASLILGNFMIFNLFLALLLNSFSSDKIKSEKKDESDGKLKKSLRRIYLCFKDCSTNNTKSKKLHKNDKVKLSLEPSQVTRLEAILDKKRPSLYVNGSPRHSISTLDPGSHYKYGEDRSVTDGSSQISSTIELKPVATMNGHPKSRSDSVVSEISNGTVLSNGHLKSRNMSPQNLQQIENAFSTQRDQYTKIDAAVVAGKGSQNYNPSITPIIITEDYSDVPHKKEVIDEDLDPAENTEIPDAGDDNDHEDNKPEQGDEDLEEGIPNTKDDEDAIVADDGHIDLPNCFCNICHKNPKLDGCCGTKWFNFRMMCAKIVTHKAFEGFILFLIAASSIMLCFDDIHLHEQAVLASALDYLNIVFSVFFLTEMALKMFALGIKKYFTGFWSLLDFVIVGVSLVDIASSYLDIPDVSFLRVLRTLRALRPLRAVSRWESMTIIVNALIFAMPSIANVLLVCLVFWLLFAIMGVQTFRGKFYSCRIDDNKVSVYPNDNDCTSLPLPDDLTTYKFPPTLSTCNETLLAPLLGSKSDGQWHWAKLCIAMGGQWSRPDIHFDNVGASYLALYQTATFEGWMEVMEDAIDHNPEYGGQSHRELSFYWYIYFMVFIICGAFFTLNLFIGVIIDKFNVLKKRYDGSYLAMFLTDNQRHYYNTLKKLGNKKPQKTIRRPKNKFQEFFYDLATNTKFELAITVVICLNMVAMMIPYEAPEQKGTMNSKGEFEPSSEPAINLALMIDILENINITFTCVFILEAIIKIIGLRFHYFRKPWNVFDFVVVLLSVLGIILERALEGGGFFSPTLLRVVRVFRIGRVLRLVKAAKGIRKLLFALVISIPALFNVATLLFLFMSIFAIIGMTFFSYVRHRGALNEYVNFETFPNSMLLLFRLCTSAGWNDVLYPLMEEKDCNNTHYIDSLGIPQPRMGGDCSSQPIAVAFFVIYLLLTWMIIINMYIAVILENFGQAHEQEEIGITEEDIDQFYVIWERYDPHATQYIKLEHLSEFMDILDAPLGIRKPNSMAIVAFNLPIIEGDRIHCLDVLMALVKRVLRATEEDVPHTSEEHKEANEKLKQQIADKYKQAFPNRQHVKVLSTTMQRKKEDVAAKTLQRAWRKHKMKQNILRIRELAMESAYHDSRGSFSRKLSNAIGSLTSRIGSAFGLSRRSSIRSTKSLETNHHDVT